MSNETKGVSQFQAISNAWNLDSDAERQINQDEIQQRLGDIVQQQKKNDAGIAQLKQKIQAEKKESEQSITQMQTKLSELYNKVILSDKKTRDPVSQTSAFSAVMKLFLPKAQKKEVSASKTKSMIFDNEAIRQITQNGEKHKKDHYQIIADIQALRDRTRNAVDTYQSSIDKLMLVNRKLEAERKEQVRKLQEISRTMTRDDFFRLSKKQSARVKELGNEIIPSMSMMRKHYLMQLSIVMETPFSCDYYETPTGNEQQTFFQQIGATFVGAYHSMKSILGMENMPVSHPKKLDNKSTPSVLFQLSRQVTNSIRDLMTIDETNPGELALFKLGNTEFRMKKNKAKIEAEGRQRFFTTIYTSWEQSIDPTSLADFKAFVNPGRHTQPLAHVKKPFALLLGANGDVSNYFFPVMHDLVSILYSLNKDRDGVEHLSQEKLIELRKEINALKNKIRDPENNSVIKKLESLYLSAINNMQQRMTLDQESAETAKLNKKITVKYHPGKRIKVKQDDSPRSVEPLATPRTIEQATKKSVRFAEQVSIIPTLGLFKAVGHDYERGMKNITRGLHCRRLTGG